MVLHDLDQGTGRRLLDVKLLGDPAGNKIGGSERRQIDKEEPIFVVWRDARSRLQRQARLAHAARAGQSDQLVLGPLQQGDDLRQLAFPADEGSGLTRKCRMCLLPAGGVGTAGQHGVLAAGYRLERRANQTNRRDPLFPLLE